MRLDQLMGRYDRLKQELENAYAMRPWQARRIDRLAGDLAATERDIAACRSREESAPEWSPMSFAGTGPSASQREASRSY